MTLSHQYIFSLAPQASYKEEDFIESSANYAAKRWIDSWPNWQGSIFPRITYIYGDMACGKTHLARIWQTRSQARIIDADGLDNYHDNFDSYLLDDIENVVENERQLLHFLNYVIETNKFLLITSKTRAHDLGIAMADLRSRLHGFKSYEILPPSEDLIMQMLVKNFSDHQIIVGEGVIKYLVNRIDRSYMAVREVVVLVNEAALSQGKKVSVGLVKSVLG